MPAAQRVEAVRHHMYDGSFLASLSLAERQLLLTEGLISLSLLNTRLAQPDHYQGPLAFPTIIDFGDRFEAMRGQEIPVAERWTEANLPHEVTVLAHRTPEIAKSLLTVSRLVRTVVDPTLPAARGAVHEYAQAIDAVYSQIIEYYQFLQRPDTVPLLLLRGAERFRQAFTCEGRCVDVEAKRLDTIDVTSAGEVRTMKFGLDNWRGLETTKHLKTVHLVIPDDCISTAGSGMAGLYEWHQQSLAGKLPRIRKVSFFAAVGVQTGIEQFITFAKALGIKDVEVMVGDLAYRYSDEFYLLRTTQEEAVGHGGFYVGDMGKWLTAAQA